MLLLQFTGLSGAGKTTLARLAEERVTALGYSIRIIDGDIYRKTLNHDFGFSNADRLENIRRLGHVGYEFVQQGIIAIIAAINPCESGTPAARLSNLTAIISQRISFISCFTAENNNMLG